MTIDNRILESPNEVLTWVSLMVMVKSPAFVAGARPNHIYALFDDLIEKTSQLKG